MDDSWERSLSFYTVQPLEITLIFRDFQTEVEISAAIPILIGCRNSNYVVDTNHGRYLLRICPLGSNEYRVEQAVDNFLDKGINRPKLLHVSENNPTGRPCMIFEYLKGISLQTAVSQGLRLTDAIVVQIAQYAARIHNSKSFSELGFLDDALSVSQKLPPVDEWYELFMSEKVTNRLGQDTIRRVKRLIAENEAAFKRIDSAYCLIHGDFRPANMVIDTHDQIAVVDWEFAGAGHALADIGQFFRYGKCFNDDLIAVFEQTYNTEANVKLPTDWYFLSKIRDLVNPLQMLGDDRELPRKYHDLREVVLETLRLFGY